MENVKKSSDFADAQENRLKAIEGEMKKMEEEMRKMMG